jgi:hypothetical protein
MPSTRGIRAGRAFVELFADDKRLVRGLRAAQARLKAFGANIRNLGLRFAALGTAAIAPMLGAAKAFSGMGDQVAKMAKRTGLSVEALSELTFVASQTGTSIEAMETGVRRMQRSIYDAGRGLSTQTDALTDLGLTYKHLKDLAPEEQFKLLAEAISRVEDPTRRAALAQALFGRAGTQLLPMMAGGAKGIEELQEQARRLGLTMSGADAKAAEDLTDAMDRLWKVVRMGVFRVGAALAPLLERLADAVTSIAVRISRWIDANRAVVATIAKVAAAVVAGGVALMALGITISVLGSAFGVLATIVTTVGSVLGVLAGAVASLLSPIGAVIAVVGALGAYIVYATGAGGKAIAWLGDRFQSLRETALDAFGGIADALAAGDLSLAVKVLWLTIKMEWTRGVNALERAWLGFRDFFIGIGYDAWYGLLATAETVWHALEVGWIETTAVFARTWSQLVAFFADTWERIKAGAAKAWNWIKSLFDESIDLEAENRLVEQQKQEALARIADDEKRSIREREAQRQSDRQRAEAEHRATLVEIGRQNLDKHRALDEAHAQRMAENEAELAAARREWQAALAQARDKRRAKEESLSALEGPDASALDDAISRIGDLLGDEVARIEATGTFNASALLGLQSGGAADRMAAGIEKIERNTRPLRDADGIAFA